MIFYIIISIRNKIENFNEYFYQGKKFKGSDGLIFMFLFYLFFFFSGTDFNSFHMSIYYSLPDSHHFSGVNFIPFTWISDQLYRIDFINYINHENAYYTDFTTFGLFAHYSKFLVHLLPISLFTYLLSPKKWMGLIAAEIIALLAMGQYFSYLLGDTILVILITYILIVIVAKLIRKVINNHSFLSSKKNLELIIAYTVGLLVVVTAGFLVLDINFYQRTSEENLLGVIELHESFDVYNGLITLHLRNASLFENEYHKENIKFDGSVEFDNSLQDYFGENISYHVNMNYLYSYFEKEFKYSARILDSNVIDEIKKVNKEFPISFESNNFTYYTKNKPMSQKNNQRKDFFEFKGITELVMLIQDPEEDGFYQLLKTTLAKDQYDYFEYTYKILKFKGQDIDYDIAIYGVFATGEEIRFFSVDDEVIEETEDYKIIKGKSYLYNVNKEEIDTALIETKVLRSTFVIELDVDDILLKFDKKDFK
jgi:hypothetical protein